MRYLLFIYTHIIALENLDRLCHQRGNIGQYPTFPYSRLRNIAQVHDPSHLNPTLASSMGINNKSWLDQSFVLWKPSNRS